MDIDPSRNEVESLASTKEEQNLIQKSTHLELLYTYRNHLIHESREPGYGMELSDDNRTPYYHGYGKIGEEGEWELVYPTEFFFNLTKTALENLVRYLKENNIDPYEAYGFSTIWKMKV